MQKRASFLLGLCCVMIALATTGGCQKLLWLGYPGLIIEPALLTDPKYDVLKKGKKKTAVLCRSTTGEPAHMEEIVPKITKGVSANLKKNVKNKKLEIVDEAQVRQWLDERGGSGINLREIGAAFDANFVVFIELQEFSLQNSPNTMQAQAAWVVQTFDVKKNRLHSEDAMKITFPKNLSLPVRDETCVPKFQRQIIGCISEQIAALYHPHDARRVYDSLEAHPVDNY